MLLWPAPWKNGWVNNREAGDLKHHRAHHDVTVMIGQNWLLGFTGGTHWSKNLWCRVRSPRHFEIYSIVINYLSKSNLPGSSPRSQKIWFNPVKHVNTLQWRHNERDGVSNHQPHYCLFNHLFRRRSKKIHKLRVTGLCEGNSPVTDEFPAQRASNMENDLITFIMNSGAQPDTARDI